jgi:predicted membrane protein
MSDDYRSIVTPRLMIGAWIALMGIVLMLDRMGVVEARVAFRLWPLVIVAGGAAMYFQGEHRRAGRVNGGLVMFVGVWLLLNSVGLVHVSIWELFWPLVLIGAGTALVMQTLQRSSESPAGDKGDRLMIFTVMSAVRRVSTSTRFRGGDVAAFMGGGRIDLRLATIPPGEEATIDMLAVMGGFEIFVPATWTIATPIVPFMGSVEDHRLAPLPAAAGGNTASFGTSSPPRLVLRGFLFMGGVHIRS